MKRRENCDIGEYQTRSEYMSLVSQFALAYWTLKWTVVLKYLNFLNIWKIGCSDSLFFCDFWKITLGNLGSWQGNIRIPETKLRHLILTSMANRLRHASGPVQPSARCHKSWILFFFRFLSTKKKFFSELRELRSREASAHMTQSIISLLMGMKFFRVKMVPFEDFEHSFQVLTPAVGLSFYNLAISSLEQ